MVAVSLSLSEGHDGRHDWRIYLEDSLPGRRGDLLWHFIGRAGQSLDELGSATHIGYYWIILVHWSVAWSDFLMSSNIWANILGAFPLYNGALAASGVFKWACEHGTSQCGEQRAALRDVYVSRHKPERAGVRLYLQIWIACTSKIVKIWSIGLDLGALLKLIKGILRQRVEDLQAWCCSLVFHR